MNTRTGITDFGATLARLRGKRVSQGALALRAGTSQSYVSRVESGLVQPSLAQAQRLLHALGYEMKIEPKPMRVRSDPAGRPAQLAMSAEERFESAAAMGNLAAELRGKT
ncbi:MAG TPA: helix-turn-helix transcriptional regulator [Solirubrobacteraceae bacterium]|jgi:transcriptional regulator with XRE-family HTH domain|nr:helix-turn-helix transcriptional regulator [Solirubrobacteraceae bacterium]